MNKDEGRIENIGLGYLWTILTGKNREYREFSDVLNGDTVKGEFIVTVGKRAIIATQVQNGKRVPIIVKRWRRTGGSDKKELPFVCPVEYPILREDDAHFIVEWFIDSDRNEWSCYHSDAGHNFVNCRNGTNNNLIYEFKS